MIVTGHLLCRGGGGYTWRFLYNDNTNTRFARFGDMFLQEIKKNSVIWCVFVYIWIRFFVLNNF